MQKESSSLEITKKLLQLDKSGRKKKEKTRAIPSRIVPCFERFYGFLFPLFFYFLLVLLESLDIEIGEEERASSPEKKSCKSCVYSPNIRSIRTLRSEPYLETKNMYQSVKGPT